MSGDRYLTEEVFEAAAGVLKLVGVEVMFYCLIKNHFRFLLVMPRTGAAAGKWCFPGKVARCGAKLRDNARDSVKEGLGLDIERYRFKSNGFDERSWQEHSGIGREYVVFIYRVELEPGEFDRLKKGLSDKYDAAELFRVHELEGENVHVFVKQHAEGWTTQSVSVGLP